MLLQSFSMRLFFGFVLTIVVAGFIAQSSVRDSQEKVHDSEVVLFVGPDSMALDSLRREMGEQNFYTAADDMNYYRSQVYPLLDSLGIPYEFVDRQPLQFEVGDSTMIRTWQEVESSWFTVVYDGRSRPRVTYAIDFGIRLADSLRNN